MKKLGIIILAFLFSFNIARGQQLPVDNQYLMNSYSTNPAFAGSNGNIEAFLGYRSSWMGIEGAPRLSSVNLNAALLKSMGLGISVKSESAGNFQHVYGELAYAYHLQINRDMYASVGINLMMYRNQLDNANVLSQGDDPFFLQKSATFNGTSYDAGAGLAFWAKGFTFGASAQRLIGGRLMYGEAVGEQKLDYFYKTDMQINGFISYMLTSGGKRRSRRKAPKLRIEPMAVFRYTAGGFNYDVALNTMFRDRIWAGGMYRSNGSVGVHLGGALQERIIMTYSYEFGLGETIAAYSSGSHEITIGFRLKADESRRKHGRSLFLLETTRRRTTSSSSSVVANDDPANYTPADQKQMEAVLDSVTQLKEVAMNNQEEINKLKEDLTDMQKRLEQANEDAVAAKFEAPFIIRNIKFGYNSDRLFPSSYPELDKLAQKLRKNKKWDIKITGHTDNTGTPGYNKRLSLKRAVAVKNYLVKKGIVAKRILTEGQGQSKPLPGLDPSSKKGREQNRRIEGQFRKNP